MNRSQLISVIAILILVIACFLPWMHIPDTEITITGLDTKGTRYGKPAYTHFILSAIILGCTFIAKIWAKRMSLLFAAINLAWAVRNYAIIASCDGGICPERLYGMHLILAASIILMLTSLFPKAPPMDKVDN